VNLMKIAIIGSGFMGREIGKLLVEYAFPILLKGRREDDVQQFLDEARALLSKRRRWRKISEEDYRSRLARVEGTVHFDHRLSEADLVIESVAEDLEVKREIFRTLEETCSEKAILCSNTSALSISEISQACRRRDRVVGLHFFHPLKFFKLMEVITGDGTSMETVQTACSLLKQIGKSFLVVKDSPAFFLSRNMLASLTEALLALESGRYTIEEIDQMGRRSDALTGPFYSSDISGLDIIYHSLLPLCERIPQRFQVPSILLALLERGRLGKKNSKGFYSYQDGGLGVDAEMAAILESYRTKPQTNEPLQFSMEHCMLRMMNESVYCVEEGIVGAQEVEDVIRLVPAFSKGLFRHMDILGLDEVCRKLRGLEHRHGPRFAPAPMLVELVEKGWHGMKSGRGFFTYS